MEWTQNIVTPESFPFSPVGTTLMASENGLYTLCGLDQQSLKTWRINFDAQGKVGDLQFIAEHTHDALLPHADGYVLAHYSRPQAFLTGYASTHKQVWQHFLLDADSPRWSLAPGEGGKLHILYSSCNPHDAHRQVHVVTVDGAIPNSEPNPLFTVPDEDFCHAQILVSGTPGSGRLAVCARSKGAKTVFYMLDEQGEVLHSGSFTVHPHSRWAVPLCSIPLENGESLLGGYAEEQPGQRKPWIARFDADMSVIQGGALPPAHGTQSHSAQAVTALARCTDGTTLALCPPWEIRRFSAKGFAIGSWQVPQVNRDKSLYAILPASDGGCFIAGRSFSHAKGRITPAAWLGKIAAEEFTEE